MTLNTQRQQYEFVDYPGAEVDTSFVVNHENYSKYYYFTDTIELQSTSLTTPSFGTKFVLHQGRHLHVPHSRLQKVGPNNLIESDDDANRRSSLPCGNSGNDLDTEDIPSPVPSNAMVKERAQESLGFPNH